MSKLRFGILCTLTTIILSLAGVLISAQDQTTAKTSSGPYDLPTVGSNPNYREFKGSYDYPSDSIPGSQPWIPPLGGKSINVENAEGYISIVKDEIAADMINLLSDSQEKDTPVIWNPSAEHWYNEPWLSKLRDGIHGTYVGSPCMATALFPRSGLKAPFTTYVLVFYNDIAARSLQRVWGDDPLSPNLQSKAVQFDEGSIIVKAAFTTATATDWEPMTGALTWDIYTQQTICPDNKLADKASVFPVNFFQFDIIVKDSTAAPKTSWVFSTLTYDKDIPADPSLSPTEQIWEKMGILGVMWGNDPDVTDPTATLEENWINPKAPVYATETLGWRGRLSGPNDGSVQNPPYYTCKGNGCDPVKPCADASLCTLVEVPGPNIAVSSCMSCHGAAQFAMTSFLLPSPTDNAFSTGTPNVHNGSVFFEPGSEEWMRWFQDRTGKEPQDAGNKFVIVATDYDMNLPFKVLPQWAQEICITQNNPGNNPVCNLLSQLPPPPKPPKPGDEIQLDYQGQAISGNGAK